MTGDKSPLRSLIRLPGIDTRQAHIFRIQASAPSCSFNSCSGFAVVSTCWPTVIRRFAGLGSTANSWAGDLPLRADSRFLGDEAAFGMTN